MTNRYETVPQPGKINRDDPSNLDALYRPRCIAVVGASRDNSKWGSILFRNIKRANFPGPVYPVNRNGGTLDGSAVQSSLREVPEAVDVAIVALRAELVPSVLDDCIAAKVKILVVPTSGFAEVGGDGRAVQHELVRKARANGVRIVGPNCMGYYSSWGRVYASLGLEPAEPGAVALLSQSGNIGVALFRLGQESGLRFHSYVSVGNQADLSIADYVRHLAGDESCELVAAYLEGVADGPDLLDAVRYCTARKPVLILKGGREEGGQRAASSHTGSLATNSRVFDDVIRQSGALLVNSYEEMIAAAQALSSVKPRAVTSVAILTDGGGFGVLGADALAARGIGLAEISEETRDQLRRLLPDYCSLANPIDVGGDSDSDPSVFLPVANSLLRDPGVDGVLITSILGLYRSAYDMALEAAELEVGKRLPALVQEAQKPTVVQTVAAREQVEVMSALRKAGIPVLESVQLAAGSLAAVNEYWSRRAAVTGQALTPTGSLSNLGRQPVEEPAIYRLLAEQGLPVPQFEVVSVPEEAVWAANRLGWPVVLKAVMVGMHRSDISGVVTGISDESSVRRAFEKIRVLSPRVMVCEQIAGSLEAILSCYHDDVLGPIVMCGLGGRLTEGIGSVGFAAVPLYDGDAERLVATVPVLDRLGDGSERGFRRGDLVRLINDLAMLMQKLPSLQQLELNPVILGADGACIVDAKAVWREHGSQEATPAR